MVVCFHLEQRWISRVASYFRGVGGGGGCWDGGKILAALAKDEKYVLLSPPSHCSLIR